MATVSEQQQRQVSDSSTLTPVLSDRWAIRPAQLALVAVFSGLFLLFNYLPLRSTDLWGHIAYGDWLLQHGSLPVEDPMMPWAAGVQLIDSAWLSQVVLALVERHGGTEWLSNLFAFTSVATLLLLARTFFLNCKNHLATLVGLLSVVAVGWSRISTIRPENFALLAFATLLWLLAGASVTGEFPAKRRKRVWLGVPLLMMAWANLHGSFVCGLAVLACYFLARTLEVLWRERSLRAVVADPSVRRWLWLGELALLATLVNPYGIDLLLNSLGFANLENLQEVLEWQPLTILGIGGREFALSCLALMLLLRHSRRRVPVVHVLLVACFAILTIKSVRMIAWYAPVFGLMIVPLVSDLLGRISAAWRTEEEQVDSARQRFALLTGRSWKYTLVAGLLVWVSFSLSGASYPILGGDPRSEADLLDRQTPVALTKYLVEHPPQGPIFNPQWWGDWLVWRGPSDLQPFVTTNIHLVPRHVWKDYLRVMAGGQGWSTALQRYHIDTVVADKRDQPVLIDSIRSNTDWQIKYEDDLGIIASRVPRRSEPVARSFPPTNKLARRGR